MPSKNVLCALHSLTSLAATVAGCLAIYTLVRSIKQQHHLIDKAKLIGVRLEISTTSELVPGILTGVFLGILSTYCTLTSLSMTFRRTASYWPQRQAAWVLGFTLCVLSTAIAALVIAIKEEAVVKAFAGPVQLDDKLVRLSEQADGTSRAYWSNDYLHWSTIAPFPVVGCGLILTWALLVSSPPKVTVAETALQPSASASSESVLEKKSQA